MKLGYTIIYVPNVAESLSFFESAFGLSRRFLHESGDYGELETGETTLAFASHELGNANFPTGFVAASESSKPLGIEIALVTPFVVEAHAKALAAGATELKEPETKPWGKLSPTSDVQTELWSKYARRLVAKLRHNKSFQPTVKKLRFLPSAEFQR